MEAQAISLRIESRQRQRVSQIGSLSDFTFTVGEHLDPQRILGDPNISLYCLNHDSQQAIFVELPPGIDLSQVPFYYQAQFDNATRLIAVPYETFYQLADQVNLDSSRLIFIHNIARCGSTLLSRAFNELEDTVCLSEPDVFSNFLLLRYEDEATLVRLLQSCVRIVFRPTIVGRFSNYGLKFRNQCVEIMDLYGNAFPEAKHLFLYRNAVDWVASLYRLMLRHGSLPVISRGDAVERLATYHNRPLPDVERFFDPAIVNFSVVAYLAASWLAMMDCYLTLFSEGDAPLPIRYENLTAQPQRVLAAIFTHCNMPQTGIERALRTFSRDSQEGTVMAREKAEEGNAVKLSDEEVSQIQTVLSRHPIIQKSDYILPGTVMCD